MKAHEIRALLSRSAGLCTLLFTGTIAVSAEPAAPLVGAKVAAPAVPVVQVFKPVAFVLCASEGQGADEKCAALGGTQTYTVAANRTLLIEQITGLCAGGAENTLPPLPQRIAITVVTGGTSVDHVLLGVRQNGNFEGFSDDTRLYADPGSTISVDLTEIGASPGGRFCRLGFSGQLVK